MIRDPESPGGSSRPAIFLIVVGAVIVGSVLCGYFNLVSLINDRLPADGRPRLSWSCPLSPDEAEYRCSVSTDSPTEVLWRLDGQPVLGGGVVRVPRPAPGEAMPMEIWLTDGDQQYKVDSFSLAGPEPEPEPTKPPKPPDKKTGR